MRRMAMAVATLLTVGLLYPVVAAVPASATEPDNVSQNLVICKANVTSANYLANPDNPGSFYCGTNPQTNQNTKDFYSGNAGGGWNELDLVPFRLTVSATNAAPASQTYTIGVALDAVKNGTPGFDFLTPVSKNTALSTSGCGTVVSGPELTKSPGFGSVSTSRYRLVTITQAKGSDCVLDFNGRLAVGSHLFPGASLHGNSTNEGVTNTNQDRSIPVNEIQPQSINKDMTASQNADVVWNVTKSPTPANLNFGNICDPNLPASKDVDITVTWTKLPAQGGVITVTTHVYATNPAHRTITVNVSDIIKSGSTTLDTASTPVGGVDVPANTTQLVLTHTTTVPDGTTNLNDTATATYTDKLTGVPVPGTATASASANVQVTTTNSTATITDTESLTQTVGTGLEFSVAIPSVGTFTNGYVAGTKTTGPVNWSSGVQNDSGSVTFKKTVYFDGSGPATGTLDDTATVTGSDGFTASANGQVTLSASKSATLTINKTTSVPVDQDTTFVFHVTGPNNFTADVNVPISKGGTTGQATLPGLADGTYTIDETVTGGFADPANQQVTFGAADCAKSVLFENTFTPATAKVVKQTIPDTIQDKSGFEFTLYLDNTAPAGPNDPNTDKVIATKTTSASGEVDFGALTDEGNYYVLETDVPDGFIDNGGDAGCTFTVDYPTDTGKQFVCTWTNTKKATADVVKVTNPPGSEPGWTFTLYADDDGVAGPNPAADDTEIATVISVDDQPLNFGKFLDAGDYYILETGGPAGFESDGGVGCVFTVAYPAAAGQTFHCTFTNSAQGHIIVQKVTNPASATQAFEFDTSYDATNFFLKNGESDDSGPLPSGVYSVGEVKVPDGWDLTNVTCASSKGDAETAGNISLQTGETVTCTFTNTQRGHIIIDKVTDPAGSTQQFEFDPSYGSNFFLADADTPNDSGALVPGTYSVAEVNIPAGWDKTGASCDDGSALGAISLQAGETVTCTFNNRQRATISVSKTLTNGPATTSFTFELRQGASDSDPGTGNDTPGILLDTKSITANATPVQLNGYLVPGVYQVCEILPGPGWTSDLGGANQFILTLNLDNSRVCADFTVGAGEAKVIAVANTQPGGAQLTIGYWKNHASCKTSKGGQAAVLDQTLAKADPAWTTIGLLTLHGTTLDCVKAVNILNKTTIDGKTKKASDPLFNMAAQLLAARLNVTGGAGTCPDSINAVNAAQALLVKYGWNGLTYGPPGYPALTAADATLANQLNNTLDLYNNGLLC